jgi:probable F420-dependent oxidoreductase
MAHSLPVGSTEMKVRIGYGLGTQGLSGDSARLGGRFAELVDALERCRFDSLWLSERVGGPAPDPLIGLAVAAGRTERLKFGTSVLVVPGRNPALLAKELASLDVLSGGRMLPAVGLGVASPVEQQAFGVARGERAAWFDEAVPLLRAFWSGEPVVWSGPRFSYDGLRVLPTPVQRPFDVWLGGQAPSELRRVGRLGDGWLPSFVRPVDVVTGRSAVEAAATEAGRAIDPEHWGALIAYARTALPARLAEAVAARRPGVDPAELFPVGLDAVRAHLERFIEVGFSKFVLVPAEEPASWDEELESVAEAVLPLQT